MTIYLGTDHAGFELKEGIKKFLEDKGYEVRDFGASSYDEKDDYPDFIHPVAKAITENPEDDLGIVLGGSGQGEAMICNRYKGVRAAVYYGGSKDIITLSKEHNNANVLSLGARFIDKEEALKIIELWLKTPFSKEERHERRIAKIER